MPSVRQARAFLTIAALSAACGGLDAGDPHSPEVEPPPEGNGDRIYELTDPASPKKARDKASVNITGAVVVAVDTFNETKNGTSAGTIYVNDLGSKEPYSGISLYNPSFIPGNLRINPGDTLDLRGEFQENQEIPAQEFTAGAFLVQLATPIGTYRLDAKVPDPIDIDIADLADYAKGRRWLNMIVRVRNVKLQRDAFYLDANKQPYSGTSGRVSSALLEETNAKTGCTDPFPKAPTMNNELFDFVPLKLEEGTVLKELVGLVTFFCNLHIAPRRAEDIVR